MTNQEFSEFQATVEGSAKSFFNLEDGSTIVTCTDGLRLLVDESGDSRPLPTEATNGTAESSRAQPVYSIHDGGKDSTGRARVVIEAAPPMITYAFWTDGGDQDDIQAVSIEDAVEIASERITKAEWADGAWGIVKGEDGSQMAVPSR